MPPKTRTPDQTLCDEISSMTKLELLDFILDAPEHLTDPYYREFGRAIRARYDFLKYAEKHGGEPTKPASDHIVRTHEMPEPGADWQPGDPPPYQIGDPPTNVPPALKADMQAITIATKLKVDLAIIDDGCDALPYMSGGLGEPIVSPRDGFVYAFECDACNGRGTVSVEAAAGRIVSSATFWLKTHRANWAFNSGNAEFFVPHDVARSAMDEELIVPGTAEGFFRLSPKGIEITSDPGAVQKK